MNLLNQIFSLPGFIKMPDPKIKINFIWQVQKGYGWMFKAASQPHQEEIFDYVCRHKAIMSRTALKYAIDKMP